MLERDGAGLVAGDRPGAHGHEAVEAGILAGDEVAQLPEGVVEPVRRRRRGSGRDHRPTDHPEVGVVAEGADQPGQPAGGRQHTGLAQHHDGAAGGGEVLDAVDGDHLDHPGIAVGRGCDVGQGGRIDGRDRDRERRRRRVPQGAGRSELGLRGHEDGEILLARWPQGGTYHPPCVVWQRA